MDEIKVYISVDTKQGGRLILDGDLALLGDLLRQMNRGLSPISKGDKSKPNPRITKQEPSRVSA